MENSCFFFIIVVVTLLLLSKCTTLCSGISLFSSSTDREALLAFKNNINPDSFGILANNWSNDTSICDWIGVTCAMKHQRVTSLSLSDFNLSGTIAPHLGNLTFLRSLDISFNSFSGIIPNELSNLRRLEEIYVQQNFLSGEIPFWLGNLHEIKQIYLNNNSLSGRIPPSLFNNTSSKLVNIDLGYNILGGNVPQIGNLSSLELLSLEFNQFTGPMPYGIFKVSSLKALNLRNCRLSGTLPSDICINTPKLYSLMLSLNQLNGQIPANISKCRSLEDLRLTNNNFSGKIPSEIGSLANLKRLYLGSNAFEGQLPQELFNQLGGLEIFHVGENRFSGPIPSNINNASKLTFLELDGNSFTGHVPSFGSLRLLKRLYLGGNSLTGNLGFLSSLTNCRDLQILDISGNPLLNGALPTSIGNLSSASLQVFGAIECNITGSVPSELGNLSSLVQLSLNSNQLSGFIPTTLGKLNNLQGLYLDNNRLQGYIPPHLCQMRNLVTLNLYQNMLTGPIPECFGELKTLRQVRFDSNSLNSTIPSNFWKLTDLLAVNVSSNYLSGQISFEIGSLRSINSLDLSWNQFSGDIPSSIASLLTIELLYFGHNKLQGSIPESLGNIVNLRLLDLSNNNLSGVIPKSLEGLRYLTYFNVSCNKLEGEIPTGGPFEHFTTQSFVQNSGLCGATRFHVPLCVQTNMRSRPNSFPTLFLRYILPPIISVIILVMVLLLFIRRIRRKQNKVPVPADIPPGIAWRRISYQELVLGTNAFNETNLLGRGGFGSVFRGSLSDGVDGFGSGGLDVAIKVFNLQLEGATKSFDIESEILSSVRHRNLVKIIGCCCNMEFKSLILAYMPNGSLEKWLYSESYCLDMLQRLNIAIDVALALEYLHHGHTFPVVHCDLKPSNILLDEDMTACVADFGISKLFDEGEVMIQTNTLATIGYTAPEYGSEGKVSINGDVYSYGILLLEMFTGKEPTNNMFGEEMSLKDWVSEALLLQENVVNEIVAPGLLTSEDLYFSAKEQCVSSVLRLAMECLAFLPEERINSIQIVAALQKIKTRLLASKNKRH